MSNGLPISVFSPAMDAGVVPQVQMELAYWAKCTGWASPKDYGQTARDFTGALDERTTMALGSYQQWADQNRGESLRTDGQLDEASYLSLRAVTSELASGGGPDRSNGMSVPTFDANKMALVGLGVGALALGALALSRRKAA